MFSRNKQPAIKSLIAQGSRIEGDVHFTDGLRIDGQVRGDVRAEPGQDGLLVISALARVEGAVHAAHVIVNGEVVGPVHASQLLELQPRFAPSKVVAPAGGGGPAADKAAPA